MHAWCCRYELEYRRAVRFFWIADSKIASNSRRRRAWLDATPALITTALFRTGGGPDSLLEPTLRFSRMSRGDHTFAKWASTLTVRVAYAETMASPEGPRGTDTAQ